MSITCHIKVIFDTVRNTEQWKPFQNVVEASALQHIIEHFRLGDHVIARYFEDEGVVFCFQTNLSLFKNLTRSEFALSVTTMQVLDRETGVMIHYKK